MNQVNGYFENTRVEMLEFVPINAKRCLEIGCASGKFGREVKRRQDTLYWGIELDELAAHTASKNIDNVICGTLEDNLDKLRGENFDCIICNDVLEHMYDFQSTLKHIMKLMSKGAVLIGSVPNVRYFPVLFDLVWNADFRYVDSGVLDRTHLHFFTKKSLVRSIEEIGFNVEKIIGINATTSIKAKITSIFSFGKLSDCQFLQIAFSAQVR